MDHSIRSGACVLADRRLLLLLCTPHCFRITTMQPFLLSSWDPHASTYVSGKRRPKIQAHAHAQPCGLASPHTPIRSSHIVQRPCGLLRFDTATRVRSRICAYCVIRGKIVLRLIYFLRLTCRKRKRVFSIRKSTNMLDPDLIKLAGGILPLSIQCEIQPSSAMRAVLLLVDGLPMVW